MGSELARTQAMEVAKVLREPDWVTQTAVFSSPKHRVWLRRELPALALGQGMGPLGFILHNPSKADGVKNDRTSGRGIGFAIALGAPELVFVNAATGIATDADDLAAMDDPIGPLADEAISVAANYCLSRGGLLIAAWGAPKGKPATKRLMSFRFTQILKLDLPLHYLRLTKDGWPEHPLYLPASLKPQRWAYNV